MGLWWLGRRDQQDGSAPGVGRSWAGGWAASESELATGGRTEKMKTRCRVSLRRERATG